MGRAVPGRRGVFHVSGKYALIVGFEAASELFAIPNRALWNSIFLLVFLG
jgi:hypothetical protein